MLEGIDHVNLVVRNLEQMAAFYSTVLGLKVTRNVTISGDWIDRTVGLKDVQADVIYLDPPAGPRVELIRYHRPEASRPPHLDRPNTPGLRHLAFRVRDVEALVARLRESGVQFLSELQRVPVDQVSYGSGMQKHIVYLHDPEGNLLELCQYKQALD